ncbi:MAG: hypothetical protein LBU36_08035, partial [Clostridiales bacterium]|nr:hypothetical protein [Clostridiales bacterium]
MLKIFKKCLALAVSGVMLLSAATVFADEASPLVIDGREITSYADVDKISVDTLVTLPKEQLRELAKLKYAEQGEIWNEKEYLELVVQWWMDQPRDQIPPTLFNAQKKVLTQDGVFYDVVPDTRGLAPIAGPYAWEVLGVGDGRDHYVDLAVHLGVAPISTIIRDPAEQAAIISEIEAHKNDGKRLEPAERPDVITYPP